MAKDRKKLQHMHSSIPDKQPTPASLEVGEIAVNNAAEQEFLSVKNTNNKVVRFSSDGQIISWIERKEVMPYVGYVRGDGGPEVTSGDTPTSDEKGSYGISNDDLLNNKSELVFKLNQVAADLTTKHDKVNGAKDMYNEEINPTDDYGVNDGAGFFIDMSRYAMRDGNPSFSALTATCQTTLSGNTFIRDGASANTYGTDTGHTLDIKVTDTVVSGKTWRETLTTKREDISGRTTTIGTSGENLHVIGKTIEVHDGDVTITNNKDITETTSGSSNVTISGTSKVQVSGSTTADTGGDVTVFVSGTTTETKKLQVTENNQSGKTENTTGNVITNTTGTTTINNTGKTTVNVVHGTEINSCEGISANTNTFIVKQCAGTRGEAQFDFCDGFTVNSDDVKITECTPYGSITITEASVEVNAGDTTINDSGDTKVNTSGDVFINASGFTTIDRVKNVSENNQHSVTVVTSGNSTTTIGNDSTTNVSGNTIVDTGGNVSAYTSGSTTEIKGGPVSETNLSSTTIDRVGNVSINNQHSITSVTSGNSTTTIGNDSITNVSGNTTADTGGDVTVTTSGKTTETKGDIVTENNLSAKTENTTGDHSLYVTGNTCINSQKKANFYGKLSTNIGLACDGTTKASATTVVGTSTLDMSGETTTLSANSTTITSCGDVTINTNVLKVEQCSDSGSAEFDFCKKFAVNSSDVDITQCGDNGSITITEETVEINAGDTTINDSGDTTINTSGETKIITKDGTTIQTTAGNTNINTSGNTNITSTGNTCAVADQIGAFKGTVKTNIGKDCSDGGQTATLNLNGDTINETGTTVNISGSTSTNISGGTVNVSGGSVNSSSSNETCISAGTTAAFVGTTKTNIGKNCSDGGQTTTLNINGTTINETGNTVNISATTNVNVNANTICESATTAADFYGATTNIGISCGGSTASTVNISGTTINEGGTTNNNEFTTVNNTATTINNSTTNYNINTTNYDLNGSVICVSGSTNTDVYGKTTNIGVDCGGTTATTINISGTTINEGGTTNNNNFTTINNTATTINNNTTNYNITGTTNIEGDTNITGDTYIDGTLHLTQGIEKKLYFQTGTTDVSQSPYDGHEDRTITIPSCVSHLNRAKLNYEYGVDVTSKSDGTYDPGENCSDSASDTISIPTCVSHINRAKLDWAYVTDKASMVANTYDPGANCNNESIADKVNIPKSIKCMDEYGSCFSIDIPLCVTGTITASGAIYSSDRNLKENINYISSEKFAAAMGIPLRSFNFKDDENKRLTYGVIAQEVKEAGLDELVHVKEDGTLGVDYTSLLILKIKALEDINGMLKRMLVELDERVTKLEGKDK